MVKELISGLHMLSWGSNSYLLDDGDHGVTVIDTGMPWNRGRIISAVKYIDRSPDAIKNILVTHADIDHIGSLGPLVKATGAKVYASAHAAAHIYYGNSPRHVKFPLYYVLSDPVIGLIQPEAHVDVTVQEGDVLDIAGGIRVLFTPGHTPDHISYYWEREKVLFAGDLFFHVRRLTLSPWFLSYSWQQILASARKVFDLDIKLLCVGHGAPIRVDKNPDLWAAFRQKVKSLGQ